MSEVTLAGGLAILLLIYLLVSLLNPERFD
jgi:K+-transporting ATPase KdpF subunit